MSRLAVIEPAEREGLAVSTAIAVPPNERFITVRIPIDGWPRREGATVYERQVVRGEIQWSPDRSDWFHFVGFGSGGFPEQPNPRGDHYPDVAIRPDFLLPEIARFVRAVVDCRTRIMLRLDVETAATHEGVMV